MPDTTAGTANQVEVERLLIANQAFFNHVHIIKQKFEILPDAFHYGMSIDYIDLTESREQFVRELINTVLDWVYSQAKQVNILTGLKTEGRTDANASTELMQRAFDKFRTSADSTLLHGQFGELLLANCIQHLFYAIPILRKMPITTSPSHERFGSDAIHYKSKDSKQIFYIGEAKSYTSAYKFNSAFEDALKSILKEHKNISHELRQYLHEDFLAPETAQLATDLINGKLKNAEYRLVSIIAYEETREKSGANRDEILKTIKTAIEYRYRNFDNHKIDIGSCPILSRITYIVFPVWNFKELLNSFSNNINKRQGGQ